jgi:hypothetical protein
MEGRGICFGGTLPPQNDGLRLSLAHERRAVGSCLLLNAVGGALTGSRLLLGKGMEYGHRGSDLGLFVWWQLRYPLEPVCASNGWHLVAGYTHP